MSANYKNIKAQNLRFSKLQPRGTFYFSSTTYNKKPLVITTPSLITPTGIQPDGARSFLDLELDVATNRDHQALYEMFKSIDDRCIDESIENMDKWFKGDVDERFIEEQFKSPITAGWANEPSEMRVELVTEHPEDIVDAEGNVISPSDVTSLSSVQVKLQLLGIWVSKEFLGCHWRALGLVANLDHESKGRRRASSPRRETSPLPPVTLRKGARRSNKNKGGSSDQDEKIVQDERQSRIDSMLERFKADQQVGGEDEAEYAYGGEMSPGRYSDEEEDANDYYSEERRRTSSPRRSSSPQRYSAYAYDSAGGRRNSSPRRYYTDEEDDGDYYSGGRSDNQRRRYSDDDEYSDYSDDY